MDRSTRLGSLLFVLSLVAVAVACWGGTAQGVAVTWNTGSGDWNTTTGNWSGGANAPLWTNDGTSNAVFGGLSQWESAGGTSANENITISTTGIQADSVTFNYTGINIAGASPNILTLTGAGSITVSEVAQGPATVWGVSNLGNSYYNTISAPIVGSVGLTKLGGGVLNLTAANTYTGTTLVSAGTLRLGNAIALPGGIATPVAGGSSLTINGGVLEMATDDFKRDLGTSDTQFQITGGTSGFSAVGGTRTVNIGGANAPVQWGSANFSPTTLVLNAFTADNNLIVSNPIDLSTAAATPAPLPPTASAPARGRRFPA